MEQKITKKLSMWTMIIAAVLLIPFFTKAPWTGSDYIFAGIVLSACASAYELITKNMTKPTHRTAVGAGVLFVIFLIIGWAATGP